MYQLNAKSWKITVLEAETSGVSSTIKFKNK